MPDEHNKNDLFNKTNQKNIQWENEHHVIHIQPAPSRNTRNLLTVVRLELFIAVSFRDRFSIV